MLSLSLIWSIVSQVTIAAADPDKLQWIKNRYCDFVGPDLVKLQEVERLSQIILAGCVASFDWPEEFPQPLLVKVSDQGIPQVNRSPTGNVTLNLVKNLDWDQNAEWLTRALVSRYGLWKGNATPPPLWLVHSIIVEGSLHTKPQVRNLLLRRLQGQTVPSLAQRIQTYDRTTDPGWDFLLYRFLKSGGLESSLFVQRLEQFWTHGYDWTQLSLFFLPRYTDLNGAELELLWRTFVSDSFATESSVCLSETASLEALETLAKIEVLRNQQLEILTPDTWFLYRSDVLAQKWFRRKQSDLEVLAISIHPYYFNACHSLNQLFLALDNEDLDGYREYAQKWNQDMLDAQQLSFETDRLLKRVCY
ncbi:MAG: hypothetical protein O7C75_18195 [Verrucomicrobia bacterium]|nr:hypothetical protein [Verrucomicrobiota bacterium]